MRKKIIVITLVSFIIFSLYRFSFSLSKEKDIYKQLDIFAEALSIVEKKYVEEKDARDLIYGALRGLLSSLDLYSEFLTPEDYESLKVETEGQFGGIGVEITIKEGLLTIISPIEDTPAWKAGIKSGDIIVKIDGEITKGISLNNAVKKLRGQPGSKVNLTVLCDSDKKLQEFSITRDIIKITDIKRSLILENNIGYIKIAQFRENTAKDLISALEKLKQAGLKGLIIDLRNNPGGLLDIAVEISNIFLEEGKNIVSIKSKNQKEFVYKAKSGSNKYLDIPMAVIINKGSASGSEILAAALRDNNRAILIGEQTFGKASVQTVIPLSDGSALRITTAKYYTPKGLSLHEKGINPDIVVLEEEIKETKEETIFEEMEKKEEFNYRKDNQILRALDLLKGIIVLANK
ncbi:MAG: S41 family peptidase [Candidatus Omnitrophica bacterium]|nr:S41 family peptidase [Candidatus Omnitrophota bacterium]